MESRKWNSFKSSLSWKGNFEASTLPHKMCPIKQNAEPNLMILVSFFSGEVTSYTDTNYCILIILEVCRSVFMGHPVYVFLLRTSCHAPLFFWPRHPGLAILFFLPLFNDKIAILLTKIFLTSSFTSDKFQHDIYLYFIWFISCSKKFKRLITCLKYLIGYELMTHEQQLTLRCLIT